MTTAMISGHLDITIEEFRTHYMHAIQVALNKGHNIVVGDAPGVDQLAQAVLFVWGARNVTVYYNAQWEKPRNNIGQWSTIGVGSRPSDKDAIMTLSSSYDIAWVRPGKKRSGTAGNIARRKQMLADS